MPKMDDVVSGEVVDSVWGNEIRDRSAQRVATIQDRDNSYLSPNPGDFVYVESIDEVQYYDGAVWRTCYTADGNIPVDGTMVATGFRTGNGAAVINEDGSISCLDLDSVDGLNTPAGIACDTDESLSGRTSFNATAGANYISSASGSLTRFRAWSGSVYTTICEMTVNQVRHIVEALFYDGGYVVGYNASPSGGGDQYSYQIRNCIVSESIPSNSAGLDGDICLQYNYGAGGTQSQPAKPWVKVDGVWRGMA